MVLHKTTVTVWLTVAVLPLYLWQLHLVYVSAHGLVVSPRSRNAVAFEDTKWWGATESDPEPESCPHCLNTGGTLARCGKVSHRNYDLPKNALGGPMLPNIQATYYERDEVVLDAVLTAHHMGHFEYKACPINPGEVPEQSCFDRYPLTFVKDMIYDGRPDPNYPDRAYVAPATHKARVSDTEFGGMKFSHKYRLPDGLNGELVLIQWHYVTSNSCSDVGYREYNWPKGWEAGQTSQCKYVPQDGVGHPEQFWNCAEVKILPRNGGGASPIATTTTTTTSPSTKEASRATTASTTSATTTASTLSDATPLFFCGSSWFDAASKCRKQCPNRVDSDCGPGERCYADTECTSNAISGSSTTTTAATTSPNANSGSSTTMTVATTSPTMSTTEASMTTAASTASATKTTITTTTATFGWVFVDPSAPRFCGSSWLDASSKCQKRCLDNADSECGPGERCYANTQCTINSVDSSRCGKTWEDAVASCGLTCAADEDCGIGLDCYSGVECSEGNIARGSGGVGGGKGGSSLPTLHLFAFLFFPAMLIFVPLAIVFLRQRTENLLYWWNRW